MSKFSEETDFTKQVIGQETHARINFFIKNKDLIYQNSDAENKFTKRLERIRQETDEVFNCFCNFFNNKFHPFLKLRSMNYYMTNGSWRNNPLKGKNLKTIKIILKKWEKRFQN